MGWHRVVGGRRVAWPLCLHPCCCKWGGLQREAVGEQIPPPSTRLEYLGLGIPRVPQHLGGRCGSPGTAPGGRHRAGLGGTQPGVASILVWAGHGSAVGPGRQVLGRVTALLGCRPISSSRANKLFPKGAFEFKTPCGARVLLWQSMLGLAPQGGRAFPPALFHRARSL